MKYQVADRAVDAKQAAELMKNPPVVYTIGMYLVCAEMALPFLAIVAFAFDREISNVLYGLGLDATKITPFFFLQDTYDFFLAENLNANLHFYDFHIFEMVAWFAVSVVVARLVTALFLVEYLDDRIEFRAIVRMPFAALFSCWLFVVLGGFLASMDPRVGASSALVGYLMAFSPRTFLRMQAVTFCIASMAFSEGLFVFLQLGVAVWRRGRLVRRADL